MTDRLTNVHATRLLLVSGAVFYVMSQWEQQQYYLANMLRRRKIRAALAMLAVVLSLRRRAAFRAMMKRLEPDDTYDYAHSPWTGTAWGDGGWLDLVQQRLAD